MRLSRWRAYMRLRRFHVGIFLCGSLLFMVVFFETYKLHDDFSKVPHEIMATKIEIIDSTYTTEENGYPIRPQTEEIIQRNRGSRQTRIPERVENMSPNPPSMPGGTFNENKAKSKGPTRQGSLCNDVVKDRPNWTIVFKESTPGFCVKQKYFKWVKRIIFANQTAVYRGCTPRTRKCGYRPYFDTKLKARINAPPCCQRQVIEIFRSVAKLMGKYGGRYFLFGGGLIGWYRNKSMVPYDHDLDIIVDLSFWRSRQFQKLLLELNRRNGYVVKKKSWNKIKIYCSKLNHNFIDLWPFSRKGDDKIKIKSSQWKVHNFTQLLPLRKSTFEGFDVWVPRDPEAMLTAEYGHGWKNELTCRKVGKFGNCVT